MRNALPGGDPGLGNARVGVEKHGLKLFPGLVQGVCQTPSADDYAGIIELTLVEAGQVLAMPGGKAGNRFCHLKNSLFLQQGAPEGGQGVTEAQPGKEEARLTGTPERLGRKQAQLGGRVVSKAAFQLNPIRMKRVFSIMFHQGEGNTVRGGSFSEGKGGLHDEPFTVSRGWSGILSKSDPLVAAAIRTIGFPAKVAGLLSRTIWLSIFAPPSLSGF